MHIAVYISVYQRTGTFVKYLHPFYESWETHHHERVSPKKKQVSREAFPVSPTDHDPGLNHVHWILELVLSAEVTTSADCGIIRAHRVLRHPVPPAPVVPPRGADSLQYIIIPEIVLSVCRESLTVGVGRVGQDVGNWIILVGSIRAGWRT